MGKPKRRIGIGTKDILEIVAQLRSGRLSQPEIDQVANTVEFVAAVHDDLSLEIDSLRTHHSGKTERKEQVMLEAAGIKLDRQGIHFAAGSHKRARAVHTGLVAGTEILGEILKESSPADVDSPGVATWFEIGFLAAEKLGVRLGR